MKLPEGQFRFIKEDSSEFDYVRKNITTMDLEGTYSYLLEVDLKYPE